MFTVIFDPSLTLIEGKFPQGTLECNCSDVLTGKFPQGTVKRDCSNVLTSKFPQGTLECNCSDVLTGKFPQGTVERDCSNVLTSKFPKGTIESDCSDNGLFSDALFSTVLDVVLNTSEVISCNFSTFFLYIHKPLTEECPVLAIINCSSIPALYNLVAVDTF